MKKVKLCSVALLSLFIASCSDDFEERKPMPEAGDEVNFGIAMNPQSRTVYGEYDEKDGSQMLYWGSYTGAHEDDLLVFSPEAADGAKVSEYHVTAHGNFDDVIADASSVAASVVKVGGQTGVKWGEAESHQFMAFYPSSRVVGGIDAARGTLESSYTLKVKLDKGQQPVSFGIETLNGKKGWPNTDNSHITNPDADGADAKVLVGNPHMEAALMYAYEPSVPKTNDAVGLGFRVLADVLEVTLSGPAAGNALQDGAEADYIEIQNVTLTANKPIVGDFDLNLQTGEVCGISNGDNSVFMNLVVLENGVVYRPKLYRRGNDADQLKVRFFMIPGQVSGASDLKVKIQTDKGVYEKTLNTVEWATGTIHRAKMPQFIERGKAFELDSWMSSINDNVFLSELSIPGSWRSCSRRYQASPKLIEQYKQGIRAFEFDVVPLEVEGTSDISAFVGGDYNSNGYPEPTSALTYVIRELHMSMNFDVKSEKKDFVYLILSDPYAPDSRFVKGINKALTNPELKDLIYQGPLDENTTLGDVRGKIVIKIKTNGNEGEGFSANETGWTNGVPALFSRRIVERNPGADALSMKWGGPTVQYNPEAGLYWCGTESDNVNAEGGLEARKKAIDNYFANIRSIHESGIHNTFFKCGIGGYAKNEDEEFVAAHCRVVAEVLNPYVLSNLLDPSRKPIPVGIVLMNRSTGSWNGDSGDKNFCKSYDLIRAIINNNNAFVMDADPNWTPKN
ncbi:MAG: hypothetical protein K2O88_08205 [Paramuribaculum sp.]|nr:hypothetical protein [Paramuribaculum sp.]